MKRLMKPAILAVAPLLMAAIWMDRQPSYKPYQAPVMAPPANSVPVSGREVTGQSDLVNPVAASAQSIALGKSLFEINCAMCHGNTSVVRGAVGKKLNPPPPGLDHDRLQVLSDNTIFNAITQGFGRMPPFQYRLTPGERWNMINYLRSRKP